MKKQPSPHPVSQNWPCAWLWHTSPHISLPHCCTMRNYTARSANVPGTHVGVCISRNPRSLMWKSWWPNRRPRDPRVHGRPFLYTPLHHEKYLSAPELHLHHAPSNSTALPLPPPSTSLPPPPHLIQPTAPPPPTAWHAGPGQIQGDGEWGLACCWLTRLLSQWCFSSTPVDPAAGAYFGNNKVVVGLRSGGHGLDPTGIAQIQRAVSSGGGSSMGWRASWMGSPTSSMVFYFYSLNLLMEVGISTAYENSR